jgi:hypothetical protein
VYGNDPQKGPDAIHFSHMLHVEGYVSKSVTDPWTGPV